jgi:4'-phosphopantetheinyl transferase
MQQSSLDPIALRDREIDIWKLNLNRESSEVGRAFRRLSQAEKGKADRFRFKKDRDHYVVARGDLRRIMGGYLDIEPDRVRFSYNKYGKPFLGNGNASILFNVSHSRDIALVAVTSGNEVGIDIEFVDDSIDVLTTAKGVFSQADTSLLEKLPPDLRTRAFFRGWTRKEAYLKALGEGFSQESRQFPVSIFLDEQKIVFTTSEVDRSRNWSLISLPFGQNYSSALVMEGEIDATRNRRLPEKGK